MTMTELIALFQRAAGGFGSRVHSISEGQWHEPTPCTDWDVRTLDGTGLAEHGRIWPKNGERSCSSARNASPRTDGVIA
jgi:hypothetical protein